MAKSFSILHLYPETLRLNGEAGNVLAISERARAFGLNAEVIRVELGQDLPPVQPALIFIGSGILAATEVASEDLRTKAEQLREWAHSGSRFLVVGSGFDLVSRGLQVDDKKTLFGLGLTDTKHALSDKHLVGEVVTDKGISGFVNWNRHIERDSEPNSLATVNQSDNPDLVGYVDGYLSQSVMASNIQGPLIPMNPFLADEFLGFPKNLKESLRLEALDTLAKQARSAILRRVNR